jgi:hypothetical protein
MWFTLASNMSNSILVLLLPLALILLFIFNLMFTKVILNWEPKASKQGGFLLILWLLPLLGMIYIYRKFDLRWFKGKSDSKGSGTVGMGFMEMDAIFNPSARHQIEARKEEKIERRQDVKKSENPKSESKEHAGI